LRGGGKERGAGPLLDTPVKKRKPIRGAKETKYLLWSLVWRDINTREK
jgi:hypothetical protein